MPVADARDIVFRAAAEAVEPDPELHLDVWAEQHVIVPKGSAFSGPYRLSHTPYARRILQVLSPVHPAKRIVARVASQMLKTQVFICAALGWIACAPANILALEPNKTVTERLSNRLEAAIRACKPTAAKVAAPRSRDSRNTIQDKEFDGGHLYILTAGSDANLAEVPVRYVFGDEINREGWIQNAREGDRVKLAEARTTTYEGIAKVYLVSSPTDVGASPITEYHDKGTQERYHVPCPHCGHLHELLFENFRYEVDADTGRIVAAWMVCPDCGALIEEHHKSIMLPDVESGGQARWVQTAQGDGETVSFSLSAFYAPIGSITWRALAKEYHEAKERKATGDHEAMQVFWNTRLARDYDRSEVTSSTRELIVRRDAERLPPRVLPGWALVLTAYADTQPDRLEVGVEAWGPGLEHCTIDHQVLWGSPTDPPDTPGSVWQRFDEIRRTPFAHHSGRLIRISAYGIDTGGSNTQDVYNYASQREHMTCVATKGASQPKRPVIASKPTLQDVDWQGNKRPDGLKLWQIGADTAKDWLANRLRLASGPGAAHWVTTIDEDLFEQLLAERPLIKFRGGRPVRVWEKVSSGVRNEMLDIAVGNLALAHYLGLHKWSGQDWQRLRDTLIPPQFTPDMFAASDAAASPAAEPELPPAHQRFADAPPPAAPVAPAPQPAATPAPSPAPVAAPFVQPPPPPARRVYSRGLA